MNHEALPLVNQRSALSWETAASVVATLFFNCAGGEERLGVGGGSPVETEVVGYRK